MKKQVVVLFGGKSSEYEVSLSSAAGALENIDRERYDVETVGIARDGRFYKTECDIEMIREDKWMEGKVYPLSLELCEGCFTYLRDGERVRLKPDCVLPMIHGINCEDGKIQGMLALAGIKVAGCGCASSALCMDKAFTKAVVRDSTKIRQAKAVTVRAEDWDGSDGSDRLRERCERELGYPMFVKPANSGSSVGVSKVKSAEQFKNAVERALREDEKVLVEECIVGAEIEVAVLEENGTYYAAHPAEIDVGSAEFYDYETKYISDASSYYIPARIPQAEREAVRELALEVFKSLGCRGYARVDFFRTTGGELVFNEINTLPGFTPISMYPKMMINDGISYAELLTRLIEGAR